MKSIIQRFTKYGPVKIIAMIVLGAVLVTGTAVAAPSLKNLKLGFFNDDSRDRLAGTGVIQYAAANFTTPASTPSKNTVHTYAVQCELSKKATSGGFKWTGTPPNFDDYKVLDSYPNGGGFVVRLQLRPNEANTPNMHLLGPSTAFNKPLSVYANCVKSRVQRGTPPS